MNTRNMLRAVVPVAGTVALVVAGEALTAQETVREAPAPRSPTSSYVVRAIGSSGYMGAYIREVTADDVERLDLDEERGVLVTGVLEDGPSAKAGLQEDDVLIAWNGDRLESAAQLRRIVSETPAGRAAEVRYVRDGRERTTRIEIASRGGMMTRSAPRARLEETLGATRLRLQELERNRDGVRSFFTYVNGGRLGVGIQTLGDQLAEYFGVEDGVLVTSVREDTPAAEAELRAGDVIVAFDGEEVEDPSDLMRAVVEADEGEVEIEIVRDKRSRTIRATLPEAEEGRFAPRGGHSFYFRSPEDGDAAPHVILGDGFGFDLPGMEIAIPEFHFELPELYLEIPGFRWQQDEEGAAVEEMDSRSVGAGRTVQT